MSGSYSPPLPLVYLEFRYLSQTKHLCFLHSWGNKKLPSGGCHFHKQVKQVPPGMADPRTVKDYLTHRWHKSFSLYLSAPSSRAAVEGRCWSPLSGDQQQKQGNGVKQNQGKFRLDTGERFFTGRVVGHWDRLPRDLPCPWSCHQASQSWRSTWAALDNTHRDQC